MVMLQTRCAWFSQCFSGCFEVLFWRIRLLARLSRSAEQLLRFDVAQRLAGPSPPSNADMQAVLPSESPLDPHHDDCVLLMLGPSFSSSTLSARLPPAPVPCPFSSAHPHLCHNPPLLTLSLDQLSTSRRPTFSNAKLAGSEKASAALGERG